MSILNLNIRDMDGNGKCVRDSHPTRWREPNFLN